MKTYLHSTSVEGFITDWKTIITEGHVCCSSEACNTRGLLDKGPTTLYLRISGEAIRHFSSDAGTDEDGHSHNQTATPWDEVHVINAEIQEIIIPDFLAGKALFHYLGTLVCLQMADEGYAPINYGKHQDNYDAVYEAIDNYLNTQHPGDYDSQDIDLREMLSNGIFKEITNPLS